MRRAVSQLGDALRRGVGQQSSNAVRQTSRRWYADDAAAGELKKTMLYDFHVEHGGKMVPFAGWSMPIQYKDSIMESTINCRTHGSLFDVSHMCGLSLKGPDAIDFLETLVVADIKGLPPGTGTLSVFTNENGGVIDDTVITKVPKQPIICFPRVLMWNSPIGRAPGVLIQLEVFLVPGDRRPYLLGGQCGLP